MSKRVHWVSASPSLKALIVRLACDADDSTILKRAGWRATLTVAEALEVSA